MLLFSISGLSNNIVASITKTFIYFLSKKGPKLLLLLYLNVPCCTAVLDTVESLSDGENRRLFPASKDASRMF